MRGVACPDHVKAEIPGRVDCPYGRLLRAVGQRRRRDGLFCLEIPSDGRLDERTVLDPDCWYTFSLRWNGTTDAERHTARVAIDGTLLGIELPLRNVASNGVSYVRLRSTAQVEELVGYLVEWLEAEIWPATGP